MGQLVVQEFVTADGFAATYRMFVNFWPTPASAGEAIAPALNGLRRFVFSRRLQSAPEATFNRPPLNPALLALRSATTYDAGLVELEYALKTAQVR